MILSLALSCPAPYVDADMIQLLAFSRIRLQALLAGALLLVTIPVAAQDQQYQPTGILAVDLRQNLSDHQPPAPLPSPFRPIDENNGRKSVLLAGGLSALLPGAGQLYAEAPIWRTILYGAVETAGWTLFGVYSSEGDRATRDFESFADTHWDITRYISWIQENFESWSDVDVNKELAREALAAIYRSNDVSLPPWERVDFRELNRLEAAVKGGFSHTLPEHGEQQYYEQIGKYIQYRAGWDDHIRDGDTLIFNPSRVTQHNRDYVASRERANDLLSYAGTALWALALNHVVSAVDAMLEARRYNVSLSSKMRQEMLPDGRREYRPGIEMRVKF